MTRTSNNAIPTPTSRSADLCMLGLEVLPAQGLQVLDQIGVLVVVQDSQPVPEGSPCRPSSTASSPYPVAS